MKTILPALMIIFLATQAFAFETARAFAEAGLSAYRTYGTPQALRIWEYGPAGDDPAVKKLKELRQAFGPVSGFSILDEHQAGADYSAVYVLLKMERAPVFLRLTCYRSRSLWRVREIVLRMQPYDFVPGFSATGQVVVRPQDETGGATRAASAAVRFGDSQSKTSE